MRDFLLALGDVDEVKGEGQREVRCRLGRQGISSKG
jgi:hypothetical protein